MDELSESLSDDEEEAPGSHVTIDQSPYRFMNGNDGMGESHTTFLMAH